MTSRPAPFKEAMQLGGGVAEDAPARSAKLGDFKTGVDKAMLGSFT